MTNRCPHCGGDLPAAAPGAHRGELERQTGDAGLANTLRARAKAADEARAGALRLDPNFIAWRGYVWTRCYTRKAAKCEITGVEIRIGAAAYRQLSEVRDRDLRVDAGLWDDL